MTDRAKLLTIIWLITVVALAYSCEKKNASHNLKAKKAFSNTSTIIDQCESCQLVFANFPKDSLMFEKLYGYPNGIRQSEAQDDVIAYFICLDSCYSYDNLKCVFKLAEEVKFDADGPAFLQSYLSDFLLKNENEDSEKYFNSLSCNEFKKHINFLTSGISTHDSFYPKISTYLKSLSLDDCKKKYIKKVCH